MIEQNFPNSTSEAPQNRSALPRIILEAISIRRVFMQGSQEVTAVADASCRIRPGDRVAIIGPSGSGKSTLLHMFAGLDRPTSGIINWPSFSDPQNLRPTQIGVSLQVPGLLPPLSVVENVALPLLVQDYEPDRAREIAYEALAWLDLKDIADQLPEELSGGQSQRISLARALVTQPRLILADEPTGQLDHPTAQKLFDLLFSELADRDTALVVTTHDTAVADRFNQVWQMRQGRLEGALTDA